MQFPEHLAVTLYVRRFSSLHIRRSDEAPTSPPVLSASYRHAGEPLSGRSRAFCLSAVQVPEKVLFLRVVVRRLGFSSGSLTYRNNLQTRLNRPGTGSIGKWVGGQDPREGFLEALLPDLG